MTVSKQSQDGNGFVTREQPINTRRNKTSSILTLLGNGYQKPGIYKYFIPYGQNLAHFLE